MLVQAENAEKVVVRESETQINDANNSPDASHRDIPDLTPEPAEPEPSSGDATRAINLTDEADENPAPYPESYLRLEKVYGGTIHDDDGTHLQGGISDDSLWQGYHRRLVTLTPQLYTCPGKGAGKDFIHQLAM